MPTRVQGTGTITRWTMLLLVLIVACGPAASTRQTTDPTLTASSIPLISAEEAVRMRDAECITTLKQHYSSEQWSDLFVLTSRYWPEGVHLGEMVCAEEVFYQTVPIEIRLQMTRIATLQQLFANYRGSAQSDHEHSCYEFGGSISCR